MIIGNGQLAKAFVPFEREDVCYFASGVSRSNCIDPMEFRRERELLQNALKVHGNKKFVYFSSCALSAPEYPRNSYYQHKQKMEDLIKNHSGCYYIFRIPQLFGCLKSHNTLINFLYECILEQKKFEVYSDAYRYVIELQDVRKIITSYLDYGRCKTTLDIANPYRYKVTSIVKIFESLLDCKADYDLVLKEDGYLLDLKQLESFVEDNEVEVNFSRDYLFDKLKTATEPLNKSRNQR